MKMNLTNIENQFKQQQQLLGNLADEETFTIIFSLITQVRQLREENEKLATLNRHYYQHFYNGNIDKMIQDFKYLMGE
jgi:hypothetical protein